MADPDEALIEAIANAIDEVQGENDGWRMWEDEARAAYAAMVAHLGLVEQWQTRAGSRGLEWFEVGGDYAQWAMTRDRGEYPLRHRLAQSDWVEVDHGSE